MLVWHNDHMEIVLADQVRHPCFWWPATRLCYEIAFEDHTVDLASLVLLDERGEAVPCQFSDWQQRDGHRSAVLSFVSDLASGATKRFYLTKGTPADHAGIKRHQEGRFLVLDNGVLQIKLPLALVPGQPVEAPVHRICWNGTWKGAHLLDGVGEAQLAVRELAFGPVFCQYELTYTFAQGGTYTACVTFTQGYDFVELEERMEDIPKERGWGVLYDWQGLRPTHKYSSTWPDSTFWYPKDGVYGAYDWYPADRVHTISYYGEDPAFAGQTADERGRQQIAERVAPYAPFFGYSIRPTMAYWNAETRECAGVFVNGNDKWDDREYAIWASGDALAGRFFCEGEVLRWRFPFASGRRSIALACYMRDRDDMWFARLAQAEQDIAAMGVPPDIARKMACFPTTYTAFLHNRYVTLNLNKVKDWTLTYDGRLPEIPVTNCHLKTPQELEQMVYGTGRVVLATKGVEEFHERPYTFEAVEIRGVLEKISDAYLRMSDALSPESRRRITALLLLSMYVCAGEEAIPTRYMLGGHPNFLGDIKVTAAMGAVLFPDHPDARYFADAFEHYVALNARYHTRPAVPKWGALGGRWTESIGTYTWGFLAATTLADGLLRRFYDGKGRMANCQVADVANWIVSLLSAPVETKTRLCRVQPTQGAHSGIRPPFQVLAVLGQELARFDPLLAEHIYAVTDARDDHVHEHKPSENAWSVLFEDLYPPVAAKPDYQTQKFTGYGSILRYGVDTPQEVSVHLQQIDRGPNYRWGMTAEGGCGSIFYFADGRAWSYNGKEDAGDRRCEDGTFTTNFGVWKEGTYRSIGMGDLDQPLYRLGEVAYQELHARQVQPYSWPEYRARKVLLVGGDYIVTYDAVQDAGVYTRFTWFVEKGKELPAIHFVKGITIDRFAVPGYAKSEHITAQSHGVWYEGMGDCMAVVSHKQDIAVEPTDYGCVVRVSGSEDHIFQGVRDMDVAQDGVRFVGRTGCIRKKADGTRVLTLLNGTLVGDDALAFSVTRPDTGVCLTCRADGGIRGRVHTDGGDILTLHGTVPGRVYIDAEEVAVQDGGIALPHGEHTLELTDGLPCPARPHITGVRGRTVRYTPATGTERHELVYSTDGEHFIPAASETVMADISCKAVLKVRGVNGDQEGPWSAEYPYFPETAAPLPPYGLTYRRGVLTWGEVYGASSYRLYRKMEGEPDWALLYDGEAREVQDEASGRCWYAVAAVNGKGEGEKSPAVDNAPDSLLNEYPSSYFEPFCRLTSYLKEPYYPDCKAKPHYPNESDGS